MSIIKIIEGIVLLLSEIIIVFYLCNFIYRFRHPFYYKISWETEDNKKHYVYVKLLKEMSLTTYKEIPLNIIGNYKIRKVIEESIKIERIYIKQYTNIKIFNKKDY